MFHRGFDLKLAADANVVVLDTTQDLLWSEAKQMIGRGCRTLGTSKGIILTVDDVATQLSSVAFQRLIEEREIEGSDCGTEQIKLALKKLSNKHCTDSDRSKIKKLFGG